MQHVFAQDLSIFLAYPRGFCAGVKRAIDIVEKALELYGPPVYVRHEIVHNRFVVDSLRCKGVIFIEELNDIPSDRPVIFSAHGVPKSVPHEAAERQMFYIDATCPLVSKVHREVEMYHEQGCTILLIGHEGHPEVVGTMGQLPDYPMHLIQTVEDISFLPSHFHKTPLAYVTQTTLSVDETKDIIDALKNRFPHIKSPHKEDICYATTNRQLAVKAIAPQVQRMLVIGSPNSSNSKRLVEVAKINGCPETRLVLQTEDIDWSWISENPILGITAGASAPEVLVETIVSACQSRFKNTHIHNVSIGEENVVFHLPKILREKKSIFC